MLMITRKPSSKVFITDENLNIVATVTACDNRPRTRLGFDALPGYKIIREEVYNSLTADEANVERR